ncbi:MAG: FKBP-type peptidyl-prolyl cis-trans isomerase [Oscillospiraceae bacterium]|nr:FKBP-type peptidyl-prolyl cis-trans isomerase [Oscillospiraceae bacterium]
MKKLLCILSAAAVLLSVSACNSSKNNDNGENTTTTTPSADEIEIPINNGDVDLKFLSDGIDEHGYWEGVNALDYVDIEGFNYVGLEIPAESHTITLGKLNWTIDDFLARNAFFLPEDKITDRAVKDGDKVNIDYVGSIDGVEFERGNSKIGEDGFVNENGYDVFAGNDNFIDDFLTQIIGHTPGETFDVNVSFPDPYQNNPDFAGKDAVFEVTVNYIHPPFTKEYFDENIAGMFDWKTFDEMKEAFREEIERDMVMAFIMQYLLDEVEVNLPEELHAKLLKSSQTRTVEDYRASASRYNIELEMYISLVLGLDNGIDSLLEETAVNDSNNVHKWIVIQAIAEDMEIAPTEGELEEYLTGRGVEEVSLAYGIYGKPFIAQMLLHETILDYVFENAKLL